MSALRVSKLGRTIRRPDGELRVLEDVDLLLVPGAAVGVTGPLDAGWRSLPRLVAGLDPRTAGSVELLGRPDESRPASGITALRQNVVFASALEPLVGSGLASAAKGVAGLLASRRRGVRATSADALRSAAGIAPGGAAATASERLRLCLALASALEPKHILLEVEPPLPSASERRPLVAMVRRLLGAGCGMLIGSRDEILLASVAGSILVFEDGRVLAEGTPESMLPAAWAESRREERG